MEDIQTHHLESKQNREWNVGSGETAICACNSFRTLGTMLDCSRNAVPNLSSLKKWIDLTAAFGYNMLMLYTEDTYEIEGSPYFGYMRGRFSREEIQEIDAYAKKKNMTLMPCIQTLAHLETIKRWPEYLPYFDIDDVLLAGDDNVYILVDKMFQSIAKCFTCRTIHIGMDEAPRFGRGKYYDKHGDCDHTEAFLSHLQKVCSIGEKYGFRFLMWADMFFKLETGQYYENTQNIHAPVNEKIPANVELVYWDYYSTDADHYSRMLKAHQNIKKDVWFAGGLWSWTGFSPHNRFSIEASKAAIDSCKECGVKDVFLTLWGDDGAETSRFTTLPSLFYAAEYAKGNTDEATIKKKFEDKLGIAFDDFMRVEIPKELCGDGTGNPEKYMLYNDCFMGIMDHTVQAGDGARFAACAAHIASFQAPREWDYLFQSMYNLYRVLEVKAELGVRTHEIYRSGDKGAIHVLICDYEETEKRLEQFYQSFRRQWQIENKAFGFEIQDIRLGGLLHRIKHCRERLQAFYDGDIRKIEELEQEQLNFFGFEKPCARPKFNSWSLNVSTNVVSCGLDVE